MGISINLFPDDDLPCLQILAGELFDDPGFREWLNRRVGKGLATWHTGGEPGEWSDVFLVYNDGEGDESSECPNGMPEHCWAVICKFCEDQGFQSGLIRLLNEYGPGDDYDEDRLVALAAKNGLDALALCQALDIHHDRTNNGGIREVIQIALEDDDAEWIEGRILSAKKGS